MSLPFNLQRLPPEAISLLRFLGKRNAAASVPEFEDGLSDIGPRSIGKAIRRLVNFGLIQMDSSSAYQLTGDGKRAYQQLLDADANAPAETSTSSDKAKVNRRLTVVLPQLLPMGRPMTLFIGVNPPGKDQRQLAQPAQLELRLSAVGGQLSAANVALEVPPSAAATPARVMLSASVAKPVRVRIDAFQTIDIDRLEPAGGMYFDIPVSSSVPGDEPTRKAVGMDLQLI